MTTVTSSVTPRRRRIGTYRADLLTGLVLLGIVVLAVTVGPLLVTTSPLAQDLSNVFAAPGAEHLLGTDQLGRDILARLLHGGRTDLFIAVVAVLAPLIIGSVLGALAGYFSGWLDSLIMRAADVVASFPFYVIVIALVFTLGNGAWSIFAAITIVSWVAYARLVRAEAMALRKRDFIGALQISGLHWPRIVFSHILPNTISQAVIYATSDIILNIGVIVTLSYFGLGIVPPTPDWGQMMSDGQQYLLTGEYALVLYPAVFILVTSLALTLIGQGATAQLKYGKDTR